MIKDVQVLRAIAIIFVVLLHSWMIFPKEYVHIYNSIQPVFRPNTGVELFFVLAGYFLATNLNKLDALKSTSEKVNFILSFSIKKIKRLSPAVYFWISVPLVMSFISNNHNLWFTPEQMLQKAFMTYVYLTNFEYPMRPAQLYGHFWAVALEMQFFVIYPIVYILLGKRNTLYLTLFVAVLMMIYRPGTENYWWWFRFDPMLWGVLCHHVISSYIDRDRLKYETQGVWWKKLIAVMVLMCALGATYTSLVNFPYFKASAASLIACVMLVLALSGNNYFFPIGGWLNKPLCWIGDRSFSLYCCHIPVWMLVKQFYITFNINQHYMMWSQVLGMLIFAHLSYRYVEPLLLSKKKVQQV
ncbi:acyltransferase family protein [Kluyvera intermedia]|uniref:Acyltransferase n=1 Tax=Kluyvera intermedia TaxID=61648 RepID=A0AA95G4K4_KLUIN|nr:acyltransferase [Kluyvera intermedia]WGL57916.1 acyltransferase [Kluyvera intermedia]